ncbi:ABC transporter permease [Sphaerisporangium corydalis]|uniref:FtsX-like permease family protein n=1 Tax=Sphaerisporangium corydalis TaxID=1441875 RepID=A0ABV9E593_9ACTN|nr:FtsX-like permease family protein [Sphaerisporangium corydalis]
MRGRTPLVLRRAFSEPLLLFAAFGSILLATTTLVALTMYATTVAGVGVRRAMETASLQTTSTTVSAPVQQRTFAGIEKAVRNRFASLSEAAGTAGVPYEITLSGRSDSYALPGQERLPHPELTRFGVYDGLERQARLLKGTWPSPRTTGTVEVALGQQAAQAMRLTPGQEFSMVGRLDHKAIKARLTGIFQLNDPFADRWSREELLRKGVEHGGYTTHGPLMVPRETFLTRFTTTSVTVTWTAVPDLRNLTQDRLRPFASSMAQMGKELSRDCSACTTFSRLPDMLTQLDQAALVARSTMLVPVLQLLLLAAYALVLTARLLVDHRRMEVALLRSRGAGSVRLAVLTGTEALLVAIPCAVIAPFLAPLVLRLVNAIPWIRAAGVRIAPEPGATTFAVSGAVALACAVLLMLPALRGGRRTYVEEQAARGRGDSQGLLQRTGGDVALLVVAALAIWQLQHYGAPVTATSGGDLGIDPLIVTGPALALLCGGMLGLRLVPRVSRLVERYTSRRPGLAPALGAWQVSRRPTRYSGPALLLTMAVAIGVVSMATSATWRTSQVDQARHQAGADLRVSGPVETPELGPLGRGGTFAALPGVTAVSPVYRGTATVSENAGTLLAADMAQLGPMLMLRPDLAGHTAGALAGRLTAGRPDIPVVPLPGTPKALTMDLRLRLGQPSLSAAYTSLELRMVLSDSLGTQWSIPLTPPPADGKPHRVSVNLSALAGVSGRLSYPLGIRGFFASVPLPPVGTALELATGAVRTDTGAEVTMPGGVQWAHIARGTVHIPGEEVTTGPALFTLTVPAPAGTSADDPLAPEDVALVAAPAGVQSTDMFLPSDGPPGGAAPSTPAEKAAIFKPLPVVVTADVAAREKLTEGKSGVLTLDGEPIRVTVAGIIQAMPGTSAGTSAVLADLPSLQAQDVALARDPRVAGEWWMSARDGDPAPAAAVLSRHPEWDQVVVDLGSLTKRLRDDPLASGLQGALILGFVAALIFALLGFLVNAAVAARERISEFAILRALGVSFRQIFGMLAVEQAFLIGLSLVGGTLLAVGVATLVVPHIVLTGQAASVTPAVLLDVPWPATLGMLAGIAVLLFAIIAGLARSLRRHGLGRALRIGEDR